LSVLAEAISVVIRIDAIRRKYRGGLELFRRTVSDQTFCSDGELARVGFTDTYDAREYAARLEGQGLEHLADGAARDLVIVDQLFGFQSPCAWAEFIEVFIDEDRSRRVFACKLIGSREILHVPPGWRHETSHFRHHLAAPERWVPEFFDFLRHEDGLDVYRDLRTGREVITARVDPDRQEPDFTADPVDWSALINHGAPWTILGLPDPHAGALEDPRLAATYREVCASLEVDRRGRFVRADGYPFYHASSAFTHGDPSWLQLICGLYHPNAHQMRFIRERFRDSMGWGDEEEPWLSEEEVGPWHSLHTLRSFLDFMQSADYATLTANTVPARTRGRLSGTIGGFGGASLADLHLSRYSRDWTIVVWWAGPEPDAEGVFPTVLGFVRSDDVERNTVHLLEGMDLFTIPDQFIATTGVSDLVAAGWCGSEEDPSIGPFWTQFSSRELAILRAAWGGLLEKEAYSAYALLADCMDDDELRSVRERFGPLRSAAYFEQVYTAVTDEEP